MDFENVLVDSRWEIIKSLSKSPMSPTDLAKKTKTSIANISIQMRLLEALGLVEKQKLSTVTRGKPRTLYSLKKEFSYVVMVTDNVCDKKIIKMDKLNKITMNTIFLTKSNIQYYLLKFLYDNYDLFENAEGFAFLSTDDNKVEILIIHDNAKNYYGKFTDYSLSKKDEERKMDIFVHSKLDMFEGINQKNNYFVSLIQKSNIIYDEGSFLIEQKKRLRGKNE